MNQVTDIGRTMFGNDGPERKPPGTDQNVNGIEVHNVSNASTGMADDLKFK